MPTFYPALEALVSCLCFSAYCGTQEKKKNNTAKYKRRAASVQKKICYVLKRSLCEATLGLKSKSSFGSSSTREGLAPS